MSLLEEVPDPRRAEGKLYTLPHVLLFSILAIVTFIDVHRRSLNAFFGLTWRRAPAHTAIRYILQGLDPKDVEDAFRRHAGQLQVARAKGPHTSIALDGKTLRGSFDQFNDRAAAQVLSALATDTALVLAHVDIADKSNEIPAVQTLLADLGVARHLVTLDALHCQKTFEAAADAGIGLIVQVKENQPTLHRQVHQLCTSTPPLDRASSTGTGRNRQELRHVAVFDPGDAIADPDWRACIAAIIQVERHVLTRNAKTGLWDRATTVRVISRAHRYQPPGPPTPSGRTGRSRTPPTTAAMSPWARTPRAPASIRVCSLGSEASPTTSSRRTRPEPCLRTAIAQPSAA